MRPSSRPKPATFALQCRWSATGSHLASVEVEGASAAEGAEERAPYRVIEVAAGEVGPLALAVRAPPAAGAEGGERWSEAVLDSWALAPSAPEENAAREDAATDEAQSWRHVAEWNGLSIRRTVTVRGGAGH